MKIRFVRDGGFAAIPMLARPFELDTDDHPGDARVQETVELVQAARRERHRPPAAGGDRRTFRVSVQDGAEHFELAYTEPVTAAAGARLVAHLEELQRHTP